MIWIAPSEKDISTGTLEKRLWIAVGRATCCCRVCCRDRSSSRRT